MKFQESSKCIAIFLHLDRIAGRIKKLTERPNNLISNYLENKLLSEFYE